LFADWHKREQKAEKAGEPFDRQRHRRDFMLGAKPYAGYCDYEEDEDVYGIEKAKADVLNSEKLLRTLIDHSVNGILRLRWIPEDDGQSTLRCIFANSAACTFLHTSSDDLINCTALELMAKAFTGMREADAGALLGIFEKAIDNGEAFDTESRVETDSSYYWLRVISEPVGDDFAVTLVNITDEKAKEYAVSQELNRLRQRVRELEDASKKTDDC